MLEKIVHEIQIDGYTARFCGVGARLQLGTYGSYGVEQLHIVLGERWQGLAVYANFVTDSGTTPVLVPESGLVDVPPEATANPGNGNIVLDGTADGVRIYSVNIPYITLNHSDLSGEAPAPTPDRWEQYVAQVKDDADRADAAAGKAENAAKKANDSAEKAEAALGNIGTSVTDAQAAANAAAQSAIDAAAELGKVQNASTEALTGIGAAKQSALTDIASAKDSAVSGIDSAGATQTGKVENAGAEALKSLDAAKTSAVSAVGAAGTKAEQDIGFAKEIALVAISGAQGQATQAVQQAGANEVGKVTEAGAAQTKAIRDEGTKQTQAVTRAGDTKLAEIDAANALLPTPTDADAGKAVVVTHDGTGYELRSTLEKNISDYYAMRRTGKVYQTRLWKFAANPTSTGEKLLDNAGLVFEPSTDTEEGQDDYLNGQNPMFEWVHVNYVRDDDGAPRPTAIEGQADFKTSGAVDVGAMQMSFWFKIDSSNDEYIDYYVSDAPHPELGLVPWPECVKADGTVLPWCIGSCYISGEASDGIPRSQPGLKPIRNNSYNRIIDTYQQKGPGYWGAGAAHNTFQILFNAIKGATKSSQALYVGTTNYNFQYEASVQRAEAETWFPVTNSQAANIVVGAYVSVGHGSNNNGAVNIDRGQRTVHAYADDVKVLRVEDLDEKNKAVYLDIEDGFDTMPIALTDSLSAPIILSSMHWWSGTTDAVRGHHDGSPGSNAGGKHPYRVQGREYAVGGYLVASDTVAWPNEDGTRTIYTAPRGTAHSKDTETIQSAYKQIGMIPVGSSETAADYWIGDAGIDEDTGAWYPASQGSGSTQGCGDRYYSGGTGVNALREYLQCGSLDNGSVAGSCHLALWNGLAGASWLVLAGD